MRPPGWWYGGDDVPHAFVLSIGSSPEQSAAMGRLLHTITGAGAELTWAQSGFGAGAGGFEATFALDDSQRARLLASIADCLPTSRRR